MDSLIENVARKTPPFVFVLLLVAGLGFLGCGGTSGSQDHPDVATESDGFPVVDVVLGDSASIVEVPLYPCTVRAFELDYDQGGPDAFEFIELRYDGDWQGRTLHECGAVTLSVWTTDGVQCTEYVDGVTLQDSPIPVDGRWVLGSSAATSVSQQVIHAQDWIPAATTGLIVLSNTDGLTLGVTVYGDCSGSLGCADVLGGTIACFPSDGSEEGKGVSVCGDNAIAGRPITPGESNDCPCSVDCQASAPLCQVGNCVDGGCIYDIAPPGTPCHDGDPCTTGDACVSATCIGDPVVCKAPNSCVGDGICDGSIGECIFSAGCTHHSTCNEIMGECECDEGYSWVDGGCFDDDECAQWEDECAPEAECINVDGGYVCVCPPGTFGDGFECENFCQNVCDWMPGDCGGQSAIVEVVGLDLWAQPLQNLDVALYAPEGGDVPVSGSLTLQGSLCGPVLLFLDVYADGYHPTFLDLHYDGAGSADGLYVEEWSIGQPTSWMITEDVRWINGVPVQHYTVWLGLIHRYFASMGPPARHGNQVELLISAEEAWATVWSDLLFAQDLVTIETWWWESDFELAREKGVHPFMSGAERWAFTIMSTLEEMTWYGVEVKSMVNQFVSEEGLLTGITVDDLLFEKAETPGDGFEFLGISNPSYGVFNVTAIPWSFQSWVLYEFPEVSWIDATYIAEPLPPFGTIQVDLTDIPFGLGELDLPIASWHQKTVTIDQEVAFIGGLNAKGTDWDSASHLTYEARRMAFDASTDDRVEVLLKHDKPTFEPRKDFMLRLEGPVVADTVEVFQKEWFYQKSIGVPYAELATGFQLESPAPPIPGGVQAQVVTTMPAPFTDLSILETLLNAISQAHTYIYMEDQYFRAPIVVDALVYQMEVEPELELIVVTNEVGEWLDAGCWQTHLAYEALNDPFPDRFHVFTMKSFDAVDTECWLCIDETVGSFDRIFIHSKMVIIDDVYLLSGSANQNNRSMLYEAEISLVVYDADWVTAARHDVMALAMGSSYSSWLEPWELGVWFEYAADTNQWVMENWDWEGFDLDLDGAALGADYLPDGFLYPLYFGTPDDCLFEGVGADIM